MFSVCLFVLFFVFLLFGVLCCVCFVVAFFLFFVWVAILFDNRLAEYYFVTVLWGYGKPVNFEFQPICGHM